MGLEESISDGDQFFNEEEYSNELVNFQDVNHYIEYGYLVEHIEEHFKVIKNVAAVAVSKSEIIELTRENADLKLQVNRTGALLDRVKDELSKMEAFKESIQELTEKAVFLESEKDKQESFIKSLKRVKQLYELLNIHIQCIGPDKYNIVFLLNNSSQENPTNYIELQIKHKIDYTLYEAVKQSGLPDKIFRELSDELMKTDDIISFLVNFRKFVLLSS